MNILLSHPTGNRNVRQALQAFQDINSLNSFYTTVSLRNRLLTQLLPPPIRGQFMRRSYDTSLAKLTHTQPVREIMRLASGALGLQNFTAHETGPFCIDKVCQSLDLLVASRLAEDDIDAVYCYEDTAFHTFQAAKSLGKKRIYEHPVGYWGDVQSLLEQEKELKPEYLPVMRGLKDSQKKRERKDQEIDLADMIITPSTYSALSLASKVGPSKPVRVVNYGAPAALKEVPQNSKELLQVLFVGSIQQQKGISYLIDGTTPVSRSVDMHVIGSYIEGCKPIDDWLNKSNWEPSLPHADVLAKMAQCEVLILPSLAEGFGLVVLEAMSQGMTVIVSDHTGAADVVEHGVNGFIVPIRSPEAISQHLELLASEPDRLMAMREAAHQTALHQTWSKYRKELVRHIIDFGVEG